MKRESKEIFQQKISKQNYAKGSILLALLISSFALVVVLALTTLSSLNINVVRSQMEYTQSLLTAQAAVSQFLYELDFCQTQNNENVDISAPLTPLDLKTRYQKYPIFHNTRCEFPAEVTVTFDDTKQYYSTDNSLSESPAKGWKGRGMNTASVPPFSTDLILNVKTGGSARHFEVLVNRVWSYAAFCERGVIILTNPAVINGYGGECPPSRINGDIFSSSQIYVGLPQSQDQGNTVVGNLCTSASKTNKLNNECIDPIYIHQGNSIKGNKHYNMSISKGSNGNALFASIKLPDKKQFKELKYQELPQLLVVGSGVGTSLSLDGGTLTWGGSMETIEKYNRIFSSYLSTAITNYENLPDDTKSYIQEYLKTHQSTESRISEEHFVILAVSSYLNEKLFGCSLFLRENLILEGSPGFNKFYLKGNLSNHYAKYLRNSNTRKINKSFLASSSISKSSGDESMWECCEEKFSKAGLILKNCTLYIDGDVELLENNKGMQVENGMSSGLSIEGNNATLIVSGNLKIMGGRLDSKDRGMVMLAKNIEFSTRGDFKGMILSKGRILINPYHEHSYTISGSKLKIQGAIACDGVYDADEDEEAVYPDSKTSGLVIKGVNLTFDPRYTKTLHQFGTPSVVLWQEIH